MSVAAIHEELTRVTREHAGRLAGVLMSVLGDFTTAEDLVQDAHFFADLHGTSAADERAAIDAGGLQATGIRYVGMTSNRTVQG